MRFTKEDLGRLQIDAVKWELEAIEHMKERRAEQGVRCPTEEEATEAALDPDRIVRLAAEGRSLKVVGRAQSSDRFIKVWLWPLDVSIGEWYGGSAVDANESDHRRYHEAEG